VAPDHIQLLLAVQQRMRRESATVLEGWLRSREPLLDKMAPDDVVIALQDSVCSPP
jgi:hypothetical protein